MEKKLNKQTSDKVSFITFIIPEFASGYKMNMQDAYFYGSFVNRVKQG